METNLRGTERMSKRHVTVAMNEKMVAIKLFKKGSYKCLATEVTQRLGQ